MAERVTRSRRMRIWEIVVVLVLLLLSFRMISLLLLPAVISVRILWRRRRKAIVFVLAWAVFILSLFSPVDIALLGYPGPLRGQRKSGPRLVRLIMGLPIHHRLVEKYGEYFSGGCVASGLEPKWIFVWK